MKPILYSFRRCPFAMRARMALCAARIEVEIREVRLSDKPQQLLHVSPSGTVPVLQLASGQVLIESLEIMRWALEQCDPEGWLQCAPAAPEAALIAENDGGFKAALDRYKYADRHPQKTQTHWRAEAERFVVVLESLLQGRDYLFGSRCSLADVAIFPMLRQFAAVEREWFNTAPYPRLTGWLQRFFDDQIFVASMGKLPFWRAGDAARQFPQRITG